VSNRRRRQEQLTTHKRAWYRRRPPVVAGDAASWMKRRLPRPTVAVLVAILLVAGGTATGLAVGLSGSSYNPVSYRIVYRVEDGTQTPHEITTQILDVRRPLYAALLTRSGPPPGGDLTSGSVEQGGYTQISSSEGAIKAQQLQPDIATAPGADLRLEPALDLAVAAGQLQRSGTSHVLGRACTEYKSYDPLDSSNWKLPAPDGDVTSCVDAQGHLLSDVWLIHDKLVRSRTAVSFVTNPKPLPNPLAGVTVSNASSPLGITSAPLSDKVSFTTAIPAPPSGWRRVGARLVGYSDPSTGSLTSIGRNLLYSNGDDVISVREQRTLGQPLDAPTGPSVTVGSWGAGHWSLTPQGVTLTVSLDDNAQLKVIGTVTRDELLHFARTIAKAAPAPSPSPTASP